jgi:hypothetical protein
LKLKTYSPAREMPKENFLTGAQIFASGLGPVGSCWFTPTGGLDGKEFF